MKIDEIRDRFLKFFEKRGCTLYPSDSLVPTNDPSLLFTGSGMNQFKDMFLGRGALPFKRATTSQKCLRTGDLERVGRTSGHQTFFEMLGHFSFGDYFKPEAIPWTWEFYTRELGIAAERLYISVYRDDPEAYDIWLKAVGIPAAKIFKLGEGDNFWPANAPSQGPNGPCGPCSEIYYDFGAKYGCGQPTCDITCGCNRYVEIGNIVFTQFDRKDGGALEPLPQRNIDFGGGLERVGAVMQGVHSNFDTDLFKPILDRTCEILKVPYEPGTEHTSRLRRIADHVRALTFCIADGALPSNDGRGYVVRRILRTALRDGIKLGHEAAFLSRLVASVVDAMKRPYPYLLERRAGVEQTIRSEEEGFLDTLQKGEEILKSKLSGKTVLSGDDAFLLYDSYGFPIELVEDLCHDHGAKVDRKRYDELLQKKKERERGDFAGDIFGKGPLASIKEEKEPPTEFLGYRIPMARMHEPVEADVRRVIRLPAEARKAYEASKKDTPAVTRLLNAGTLADEATGDIAVLLNRTPFYGESGGQVGDSGWIDSMVVEDCKRPDGYFFHIGKGSAKVGAKVQVRIDAKRRLDIMRNHTGTHVLQAALRAVLGSTVQQAGSVVDPDRLRFDFTYPQGMTREQIRQVEDLCNDVILADLPVTKEEMPIEEAKKKGAIAFFGEKYGDRVRVVTVGEAKSIELCGGTHLEHTATIGQIKITSESSIQRGVRRLEAVSGPQAIELAREKYDLADRLAAELGCPVPDIAKRVGILVKTSQELKQEIGKLKKGGADSFAEIFAEFKRDPDGAFVIYETRKGSLEDARAWMDNVIKKQQIGSGIIAVHGEKPAFVIGVREDLVKSKGLKAGDLAKEIGKACGGGGGGREFQAQAGASDPSRIAVGFQKFEELVRAKLG